MIPTPQRIRSIRLWSAAMAAAVVLVVPAALYGLTRHGGAAWIALAASVAAGGGLHWARMRVMRRRGRVLRRPFPPQWEQILTERVAFYAELAPQDRERFGQLVAIFLDETPVRGAGCEVDEVIRVLVAASAVIPIFALPDWEYAMLRDVVVREGTFILQDEQRGKKSDPLSGMVEGPGGAFHGTLVLSLPDLEAGFAERGEIYNVGIHEFAHLMDEAKGGFNGVPASLPADCLGHWQRVVRREMEQGAHGPSDIPEYAFTNEQEFFAVAAEYFFQAPDELAANHPELYALLCRAFRQDLRTRPGRPVRNVTRRSRRDGRGGGPRPSERGAPWG